MKITAGMGQIDDYEALCKAGVDEVFCGIVPLEYSMQFGNRAPLNRREVMYTNVQIGSYSDLKILGDMKGIYEVPIAITLNSPSYPEMAYPYISQLVLRCLQYGFDTFIIASVGLLMYLKKEGLLRQMKVHISGEIGEMNSALIDYLNDYEIERVIFHRKMNIEQMKSITTNYSNIEYEAFILNELCHYNGGYCNSVHCDELIHMCQVPYILSGATNQIRQNEYEGLGESGCGICSIYGLKSAGVEYLKVVGRGNYAKNVLADVKNVRKALEIMAESSTEETYIKAVKDELFSFGCSGKCYYYKGN